VAVHADRPLEAVSAVCTAPQDGGILLLSAERAECRSDRQTDRSSMAEQGSLAFGVFLLIWQSQPVGCGASPIARQPSGGKCTAK